MNHQEDLFNNDIGPIEQDPDDVNYLEVSYDEYSDEEGDTTNESLSSLYDFNPYYPVLENPEQINLLDIQPMPEINDNDLVGSQNGGKAKKAKKTKKTKKAKKAKKTKKAKKAKKTKKAKTAKKAKKTKAKKAKK